jgi:hypothetical protein
MVLMNLSLHSEILFKHKCAELHNAIRQIISVMRIPAKTEEKI